HLVQLSTADDLHVLAAGPGAHAGDGQVDVADLDDERVRAVLAEPAEVPAGAPVGVTVAAHRRPSQYAIARKPAMSAPPIQAPARRQSTTVCRHSPRAALVAARASR